MVSGNLAKRDKLRKHLDRRRRLRVLGPCRLRRRERRRKVLDRLPNPQRKRNRRSWLSHIPTQNSNLFLHLGSQHNPRSSSRPSHRPRHRSSRRAGCGRSSMGFPGHVFDRDPSVTCVRPALDTGKHPEQKLGRPRVLVRPHNERVGRGRRREIALPRDLEKVEKGRRRDNKVHVGRQVGQRLPLVVHHLKPNVDRVFPLGPDLVLPDRDHHVPRLVARVGQQKLGAVCRSPLGPGKERQSRRERPLVRRKDLAHVDDVVVGHKVLDRDPELSVVARLMAQRLHPLRRPVLVVIV